MTIGLEKRKTLGGVLTCQNDGAKPLLKSYDSPMEKQLLKRFTNEFVGNIVAQFNQGLLSASQARELLGIGKTRLYQLRTDWLRKQSGGSTKRPWTKEIRDFVVKSLIIQKDTKSSTNFAAIADELEMQYGFKRSRSAIRRYALKNYPNLLHHHRKPRHFRRWQKEEIGSIWQHDTTPLKLGITEFSASLILTLDDASRYIIRASVVPRETLWSHFCHFRQAFTREGIPLVSCVN